MDFLSLEERSILLVACRHTFFGNVIRIGWSSAKHSTGIFISLEQVQVVHPDSIPRIWESAVNWKQFHDLTVINGINIQFSIEGYIVIHIYERYEASLQSICLVLQPSRPALYCHYYFSLLSEVWIWRCDQKSWYYRSWLLVSFRFCCSSTKNYRQKHMIAMNIVWNEMTTILA